MVTVNKEPMSISTEALYNKRAHTTSADRGASFLVSLQIEGHQWHCEATPTTLYMHHGGLAWTVSESCMKYLIEQFPPLSQPCHPLVLDRESTLTF